MVNAAWYGDSQRIHVKRIAGPSESLAVGFDLEADHRLEWAGRTMFARHPFGIDEGEWSWLYGKRQFGVNALASDLTRINSNREVGRLRCADR